MTACGSGSELCLLFDITSDASESPHADMTDTSSTTSGGIRQNWKELKSSELLGVDDMLHCGASPSHLQHKPTAPILISTGSLQCYLVYTVTLVGPVFPEQINLPLI